MCNQGGHQVVQVLLRTTSAVPDHQRKVRVYKYVHVDWIMPGSITEVNAFDPLAQSIHVISPHRDDAALVFGGQILAARCQGLPVTIHAVFTCDDYVDEVFGKYLEQDRLHHPHVKRLLRSSAVPQDIRARLEENLAVKNLDEGVGAHARFLIRLCEEFIANAQMGTFLIEYDYPSALLRGYQDYRSRPSKADIEAFYRFLVDGTVPKEYQDAIQRICKRPSQAPIPSLSQRIIEELQQGIRVQLWLPAGIGGHTDHVATIAAVTRLERQAARLRWPLSVHFGEDLPYALEPLNYRRTPLPLENLSRYSVDVTAFALEKIRIIRNYISQLRLCEIEGVQEFGYCSRFRDLDYPTAFMETYYSRAEHP
jgi:LmbE family N-acetylglucosaminyl deacetylase